LGLHPFSPCDVMMYAWTGHNIRMFEYFDVRSWLTYSDARCHEIDENEAKHFLFYGVYSIGCLCLNSMNHLNGQSINQSINQPVTYKSTKHDEQSED